MDLSLGCNRFAALMQNRNPARSPCGLDPDVANLYLTGKYGCTERQGDTVAAPGVMVICRYRNHETRK
jgi:hypothetical protein